jgi:hypothetical protein
MPLKSRNKMAHKEVLYAAEEHEEVLEAIAEAEWGKEY